MHSLNLLIKPVGDACNLSCRYCFYHSPHPTGKMSVETLEKIVRKGLSEAEKQCTFAFQGGEPTLAGLDFYRKLIEFEEKYNRNGVQIQNILQTNGTRIDEEWATFLHEHRFLVGLSMDGPADIHNLNRLYPSGDDSHKDVRRAAKILEEKGVPYNILCVVTKAAARHPAQIYRYLRSGGFDHIQFIPCLDPLDRPHGGQPYSLNDRDFAGFLMQTFDLWYQDICKGEAVSLRYFDNLVQLAAGYPPESCGISGACTCQNVIEADGCLYPCDFYVRDEWKLGSINDTDFATALQNSAQFIEASKFLPDDCKACRYAPLCRNGCRRERDETGKNIHCTAYRTFFDYAAGRILQLARALRR